MLIPHLGYLIVAIVSALATAYLNIEIPQSLGQIVNVVATFVRTNGNAANESMSNFLNQIRDPAKQIVKMYLAQGWAWLLEGSRDLVSQYSTIVLGSGLAL